MGEVTWTPTRRTAERRNGETGTVRTITETECRVCRGHGARQVEHLNGELAPERVKDVEHWGRRGWLRRHGYDDGQIAVCDGCNGIGWVEDRRRSDG